MKLRFLIVFFAIHLPLASAEDRVAAARSALEGRALSAIEAEAVSELLADLVQTQNREKTGRALREIQGAANVAEALKETGFAELPHQVAELIPAYEKISAAWSEGRFTAVAFRDAKQAWELVLLMREVANAARATVSQGSGSWASLPMDAALSLVEVSEGPLALAASARSLSRIYRNHAGDFPEPLVENFFRRPTTPLFSRDFHHYGFARQLGLVAALRLAKTAPALSEEDSVLLQALWASSFVDTCHQFSGLRLAKESATLIQSLEQAWAKSLMGLPDFAESMLTVVEALKAASSQSANRDQIERVKQAFISVLQEIRSPSIRTSNGMLSSAESVLADARANPAFVAQLIDYLTENAGLPTDSGDWQSFGTRTAATGANVAAYAFSAPRRLVSWGLGVPVARMRTVSNISSWFQKKPKGDEALGEHCSNLLKELGTF